MKAPPYFQSPWELYDAGSIQALSRGEASPEQQIRAIEWIVHVAAMVYQPTFDPESDHTSAFMEGRRFVGLQIIKLTKLDLTALKGATSNA